MHVQAVVPAWRLVRIQFISYQIEKQLLWIKMHAWSAVHALKTVLQGPLPLRLELDALPT